MILSKKWITLSRVDIQPHYHVTLSKIGIFDGLNGQLREGSPGIAK
jgi:hypothetical protein